MTVPRRRWSFGLRTLFVATAVAAVFAGIARALPAIAMQAMMLASGTALFCISLAVIWAMARRQNAAAGLFSRLLGRENHNAERCDHP